MRCPKSYKKITVEQYQQVYPLIPNWDKTKFQILSILSGKSIDYVESLELKILNHYLIRISFLRKPIESTLKIKYDAAGLVGGVEHDMKHSRFVFRKKLFYGLRSVTEINTDQYRNLNDLLIGSNEVEQLHNLAAICYRPAFRKYNAAQHAEHAELFKKAKVSDIYPTVFFCSEVLINWNLNTPDYLESREIIRNHLQEMNGTSLESIGGSTLQ
jgi:hypothetical protein